MKKRIRFWKKTTGLCLIIFGFLLLTTSGAWGVTFPFHDDMEGEMLWTPESPWGTTYYTGGVMH